ncbi:MAG: transglutaminase family protein, partial [Leptospiraceae bacterium]|nr:transglutaminase family protein [Leptospiraceae bacterium]
EVYLPGAGWIGLDPTSGLFAGEGHIPLACTPDPSSAAPITGATEKADVEFKFSMSVTRINEKPRTTKPYTEEEWQKIYAFGKKLDEEIFANDIRLTMGGEPTFISVDNMDAPEWNTEAQGPTKKRYATTLLHRLKDKFGNGALLHFGQGKWYPGESLPRWALGCYWRKDKTPIWKNQELYGDESQNFGYTEKDAFKFITVLAEYLGVTKEFIHPGYEDIYYYLWKEGNLPKNFDPLDVNLRDKEERARLLKLLERGLDKIAGFALPLRWNEITQTWETGPRTFRRGRMYLIPGDSPMGFRLPLDSFPYDKNEEYTEEPSPFEKRPSFLDYPQIYQRRRESRPLSGFGIDWDELYNKIINQDSNQLSDYSLIRTTLCVEPRNGNLYIFIPPMVRADEYLDLISAVESTAQELGYRVLIEGYTPPKDYRLSHFLITPDPGVIEVNIHPAYNWDELNYITETIYEEARLSRLTTCLL